MNLNSIKTRLLAAISLLFCCLSTSITWAQTSGVIRMDSLVAADLLQKINLSQTDVILLGEEVHQDGMAMRVNAEIISYLNEKEGFTNLIIESDFFSLYQYSHCDTCHFNPEDNIYKGWSATKEFAPILDLVKSKKLTIYGCDSRHHGKYAATELVNFLSTNALDSPLSPAEQVFISEITQRILALEYKDTTSQKDADHYLSFLNSWKESIADSSSFLKGELQNLSRFATQSWIEKSSSPAYIEQRELNMIANVNFLLNHTLKGQKTVVLGANLHVEPGIVSLSNHSPKNIGDEVKANYRAISILPINYEGTSRTYKGIKPLKKPAKGTLPYLLAKQNINAALIDLHQLTPETIIYKDKETLPSKYGDYLFFIRKTAPSQRID